MVESIIIDISSFWEYYDFAEKLNKNTRECLLLSVTSVYLHTVFSCFEDIQFFSKKIEQNALVIFLSILNCYLCFFALIKEEYL